MTADETVTLYRPVGPKELELIERSATHQEYWIPAEELAEFNANIVGPIEVVSEFSGQHRHRDSGGHDTTS